MTALSVLFSLLSGLCAATGTALALYLDWRIVPSGTAGRLSGTLLFCVSCVCLLVALPGKPTAWFGAAIALSALPLVRLALKRSGDRERRSILSREVPTLLDSLVLRAEAGLALVPSLIESAAIFPPDSPVRAEIRSFSKDLELGKGAAEALRSMKERMNVPSSDSALGALIRGLEMGTPVRRILKEQSERARQTLLTEAELFSNTLAVRLMLPLVLFIFPASFLVILSPVLVALLGNRAW